MPEKNDSNAGNQGGNDGATPIHTQADLDRIITERLARQAKEFEKRYEGFEDYKAKAAKFDEHQSANQSETEKAKARADEAERKLAERDAADKKREDEATAAKAQQELVAEIAKAKGVDGKLLRGATREDLEAHAADLLAVIPAPKNGSDSGSGGQQGDDIKGGELTAEQIVEAATAR